MASSQSSTIWVMHCVWMLLTIVLAQVARPGQGRQGAIMVMQNANQQGCLDGKGYYFESTKPCTDHFIIGEPNPGKYGGTVSTGWRWRAYEMSLFPEQKRAQQWVPHTFDRESQSIVGIKMGISIARSQSIGLVWWLVLSLWMFS